MIFYKIVSKYMRFFGHSHFTDSHTVKTISQHISKTGPIISATAFMCCIARIWNPVKPLRWRFLKKYLTVFSHIRKSQSWIFYMVLNAPLVMVQRNHIFPEIQSIEQELTF